MTINLRNVLFTYPDTKKDSPVLKIPKWSVAAGEKVFVHGPSGGGKSTLLNIISGMIAPDEGEVSILDTRLDKLSNRQRDKFRADHVGYVFQHFNLIPYLNAIENVQLAARFSKRGTKNVKQNIEILLQQLNITSENWHKRATTLSIGQQQRVAIARALINKPELLIADEPTSSLDQPNRDNFMSVLMSLAQQNNITLLFVSHDMSLSKYFERKEALSDFNQLLGEN